MRFFEEYIKHAALNFGQAVQGIRYFYSHPLADDLAPRGGLQHFIHSFFLRTPQILNDLFFAVIPPHWHHSRQELQQMCATSFFLWFQYGYCAWRFTEAGELKPTLDGVDRRWDPRCDDALNDKKKEPPKPRA